MDPETEAQSNFLVNVKAKSTIAIAVSGVGTGNVRQERRSCCRTKVEVLCDTDCFRLTSVVFTEGVVLVDSLEKRPVKPSAKSAVPDEFPSIVD